MVASALVALAPRVGHAVEVFESVRNFSQTRGHSSGVSVSIRANYIFVSWLERQTGNGDVYFRRSTDRGLTYSAPVNLSEGLKARASDAVVIRVEGNVYVLWEEDGIRLRVSHDYGETFGPLRRLSDSGREPRIAAFDEHVYVLWSSDKGGSDVLFRASHDFGESFDAPLTLSGDGRSRHPALAADGAYVYVVWDDKAHISLRRSVDSGRSFEPPLRLDEGKAPSCHPQLTTLVDSVHVVWEEGGSGRADIVYRRGLAGGASFGPVLNLSRSPGDSHNPLIDSFETSLSVIWEESLPGNSDIFFTRSLDGGATFDVLRNVSETATPSSQPSLSTSGEVVRIAWREDVACPGDLAGWREDEACMSEIFYRSSDDRGTSFGTTQNVSETPTRSSTPLVLSSHLGVQVHVFWEEHTPGNVELFYRRGEPLP